MYYQDKLETLLITVQGRSKRHPRAVGGEDPIGCDGDMAEEG